MRPGYAGIQVTRAHLEKMRLHVETTAPLEACGLLGGSASRVERVVPVANMVASPIRYRMDPEEQICALFGFEKEGLELVAIYHSHPVGPNGPSQTDLREAAYPEAIQLIWFKEQAGWSYRAFRFDETGAIEVTVKVGSREE